MWGKLAFFCPGSALGTRPGRDGAREALELAGWTLCQEEIQPALGVAHNAAAMALERGQAPAVPRVA